MLSLTEIEKLSKKFNVISISREVILDFDTPVSIYIKSGAYKKPYSFLLESVIAGEERGRYSIIGFDYYALVKGRCGKFTYTIKNSDTETLKSKDAIFALEEVFKKFRYKKNDNDFFTAGSVGFFSYDVIRYYEDINGVKPLPDPLDLDDMIYTIPNLLIIFDHAFGQVKIISNIFVDNSLSIKSQYEEAINRIEDVYNNVIHSSYLDEFSKLDVPNFSEYQKTSSQKELMNKWQSNTTEQEYNEMVHSARKYTKEGDIFQVVLSKRFSQKFNYHPFFLYRSLRVVNPSPYMFFLNFPNNILVGSSPEILVQKSGNNINLRPIAGTVRRGKNKEEDEILGQALLRDKKEVAEHTMLIDLGRNDVGRISKAGSVKVTDFMIVEKYSQVMHIVSNVTGSLKDDCNAFSVLWSSLPAGTVSGAPKVRAMQIIEELEKEKRGVYSGCIGYLGFDGNMDSAIVLRTMLIKDNTIYVQAGAGLVYDSDPEKENQEIFKKSEALFKAVELFYQGRLI